VIEVSRLSPQDWRLWRGMRLTALAEAPHAFTSRLTDWQGENDLEERWRARLDIPGSHNVIAAVDGQPAGMASGVPTDAPAVVELISMWVAPAARGHGVGDVLIEHVAGWARRAGATVLRLEVAPDNPAALALYRRNGFEDTGEAVRGTAAGARCERVMAKWLSSPRA
jgi:ribosomal protein S18 acetylase RimI-like enzyme